MREKKKETHSTFGNKNKMKKYLAWFAPSSKCCIFIVALNSSDWIDWNLKENHNKALSTMQQQRKQVKREN